MKSKIHEHQKISLYFVSKKIILTLALATVILVSCQDKTKEKLEDAKDAVTEEVKAKIDSAKVKAETEFDSVREKAKTKLDSAKIKSAEKLEAAAKKLKESVKK